VSTRPAPATLRHEIVNRLRPRRLVIRYCESTGGRNIHNKGSAMVTWHMALASWCTEKRHE